MCLNDIVSRFQSPKKNGNNSFMVRCPCHNDNTQSLSISEKNGKILFNCFAGCRTEDILHSAGLEMKDLFADKPSFTTPKPPSVEYIYSDRLKKIRYYKWDNGQWKKSFYWQYKDENGNWQSGKGNYKVPLYKQNLLSDVPPEETVYIVEGEKDCDTMTDKLHFRAVSAPNGATATKGNTKSKWNSDYNSLFSNLNVAIIPDNDEVGRAYAETIANELLPVAKSVKIVDLCNEWENLKDKGDITDVYESEQPIREMTVAESVAFRLSAWVGYTKPYERKPQSAAITDEPINEAEPRKTIVAPVWAYEDNGQWKIDEKVYITEFVKNHGVKCINGQLYSVDGEIPDGKAKQIIIKEILYYVKANHGDKAEKLLKGIKSYCYIEPPKPSLDKIHFKNGTLSKDENGLFTVWSDKKEFCINRIDSNYNPSAPIPKLFYNYLQEVYYPDDIKTLQQYCGYCLIPTTALQKALIVIGDGGEGKSVIGSILHGIFGNSNIYRAKIKKLNSEFGQCDLFGKLLMIDDDLSENALTDTSIFKELVTAKREITVNKKYVQGFTFTPYARFIIFGNFTLQALYDISNGFARRQLVLQAKPKNENRVDNPFLDEEIVKNEAEGVINWLVQGLNELIKNNLKLYVSERTNEVSEQLKRESNSVQLFLDECEEYADIMIRPNLFIHSCTLYEWYSKYCDENILIKKSSNKFVSALKSIGKSRGVEYKENVVINGIRRRGFEGIGVGVDVNY